MAVQLIIRQQQFLELLEEQEVTEALGILQQELSRICENSTQLHYLSRLLMCSTPNELRMAAKWGGVKGGSRLQVLESLQRFIAPQQMVPPHRMETLLKQAARYQQDNCEYHISPGPSDLYIDHKCKLSSFPTMPAHTLKGHSDEVWFVAFSNNGEYIATASKDQTCIIWNAKVQTYHLAISPKVSIVNPLL